MKYANIVIGTNMLLLYYIGALWTKKIFYLSLDFVNLIVQCTLVLIYIDI